MIKVYPPSESVEESHARLALLLVKVGAVTEGNKVSIVGESGTQYRVDTDQRTDTIFAHYNKNKSCLCLLCRSPFQSDRIASVIHVLSLDTQAAETIPLIARALGTTCQS